MQTEQRAATIDLVLIDAAPKNDQSVASALNQNPFQPGTIVVVTLGNPREKFWGAILTLNAQGLSLCGIELGSFDNLISMVKDGEPFSPNVVFFPMHRVERMELDLPEGNIPSLAQRFAAKTGMDAPAALSRRTLPAFKEQK